MIKEELRREIYKAVKEAYPKVDFSENEVEIEIPKNLEFGDLSSNIGFKLAKKIGEKPEGITEKVFACLFKHWPKKIDTIEVLPYVSGYLNFKFTTSYFVGQLKEILAEKEKFGDLSIFKGQKVQVEFISANPTGPLTLANGRGGFGGDVLANVFIKAGAEVQREYLVNDGGNQVKILGDSLLYMVNVTGHTSSEDLYKGDYLKELLGIYENEKKFSEWSKMINPTEYGRKAAKDILENYIKPSVKKMKIGFDSWFSEQRLINSGEVDKTLADFAKKGLTYEKEDALWFRTTKFGDDRDRVLKKSDGEYTYFATDAAYHWDKFAKRKFDKVVNFLGADHHGYVGRMQAVVTAMGFGGQLDLIIMQMVRLIQNGQEVRMSKRKGAYVTMDDLLEMIGENQEPSTSAQVREASDVARFFFLSRAFNTHMDFNLDLAREHSEKNPVFYVKYAHARIAGILGNAEKLTLPKVDYDLLGDEKEKELIGELIKLPEIIKSVITDKNYPVHYLTFYAQEIAAKFHAFYDKCRVIDEANLELTAARLKLVEATKIVLVIVMKDLLGIEAPERM
jgi:arginyl-tRNA synthetase